MEPFLAVKLRISLPVPWYCAFSAGFVECLSYCLAYFNIEASEKSGYFSGTYLTFRS